MPQIVNRTEPSAFDLLKEVAKSFIEAFEKLAEIILEAFKPVFTSPTISWAAPVLMRYPEGLVSYRRAVLRVRCRK